MIEDIYRVKMNKYDDICDIDEFNKRVFQPDEISLIEDGDYRMILLSLSLYNILDNKNYRMY